MAPRESIKATPKMQRTVSKTKVKASPIATIKKTVVTRKLVEATPIATIKKTVVTRKLVEATPIQVKSRSVALSTPKPKENKPVPVPSSVTKSGKKLRRPKKAHSGVPVPSKMLKMMGKQLQAAGTL